MTFKAAIPALAALALLSACAEKEPILEGERVEIRADLGLQAPGAETRAAETARAVPLAVPGAQANADWTHRNGNAAHRLPHPALNPLQGRVFAAPIGQGNNRKHKITADPVVAGGRIFTLDSRALVVATAASGARIWAADLTPAPDKSDDASGGGLATEGGRVFATTGFGELVALDAATGAVVWRQSFDAAVGGAPTVADGVVYAIARDSSAWAMRASDGRVVWQLQATPTQSSVAGASAPAISGANVIFPFPSGEVVAVDRATGARVWTGQVAGARPGRAYGSIVDLTGDPVVAGGTIYTGSSAGRLVASNAETGQRIWSATEGAVSPVWPVGDAIFMVTDQARLVRLDAATGAVVWGVPLPYFVKDKIKRQKAITASFGPVLAGGRLYVASSDDLLRAFDPVSGALLAQYDLPGGAASAPVVAGGTLYVVSAKGEIHAFR